jgi:hypothetical protein
MIDYHDLPNLRYRTFVYNEAGRYQWIKPRGITMMYIICMGSGSGGGGGRGGAIGSARGGGGSGTCSSVTRMILPAIFVPNELYIVVGAGGIGGNGGTNNNGSIGGSANLSYIEFEYAAVRSATNTLIVSDSTVGTGGVGGSNANVGGGTAGLIATQSNAIYHNLGTVNFIVGVAGVTGASTAGGVATTYGSAGNLTSPGTGGAGVSTLNVENAGGVVNVTTITPPFFALSGGVVTGGKGQDGYISDNPIFFYGGTGGGSNNTGTGGDGGNGGPGCGGGGGAGGTPTGGKGGNGGDGLIYITCW